MNSPMLRRASYLLARSARRHRLTSLPVDTLAETIYRLLNVVFDLGEIPSDGLRAPRSTREGVGSRYIVFDTSQGMVVASVGSDGTAMAALMSGIATYLLIRGSIWPEAGPLGALPLVARKIPIDAPRSHAEAFVCMYPKNGLEVYINASKRAEEEVDRAILRALDLLASLPEGREGCDPAKALREAGWSVREERGFLRASRVMGERVIVAVLGREIEQLNRRVREEAYTEACGEVMELQAEATLASKAIDILGCARVGRRAEARVGSLRLALESTGSVMLCMSSFISDLVHEGIIGGGTLPYSCRDRGDGGLTAISLGNLSIQASIGDVKVNVRLEGPLAVDILPDQLQVAAVAPPAGEPRVLERGLLEGGVEILDPGYKF
ncbi:MAG: hypothetical protein F7B17_05855 [Desulfurococcales archaeon]|nr:hypothetical protein [Desulfurococcales archaeon]